MPHDEKTTHIASALRAARLGKRLTQAALAKAAGCDLQHVKDIEKGRRKASPELAGRLARACDLESWGFQQAKSRDDMEAAGATVTSTVVGLRYQCAMAVYEGRMSVATAKETVAALVPSDEPYDPTDPAWQKLKPAVAEDLNRIVIGPVSFAAPTTATPWHELRRDVGKR
jgi:transcriptional regulator with XRE-family HTH domain